MVDSVGSQSLNFRLDVLEEWSEYAGVVGSCSAASGPRVLAPSQINSCPATQLFLVLLCFASVFDRACELVERVGKWMVVGNEMRS